MSRKLIYSGTTKYNFDFGGVTEKQTPSPNGGTGPKQFIAYDAAARVSQVTNSINAAYVRYVYGPTYVQTYATVNTAADEAYSISFFDGAGRTYYTASNHPGSSGGYRGVTMGYDIMGRVRRTSNPTEVSSSSYPTGDDSGWFYTTQTYDFKGRPLVTTNTDGTQKTASYSGCGCAGGEVVTLTDEGTLSGSTPKQRQQKIYHDVFGRVSETKVLNWDGQGTNGTGGTVYAATVNTYDVLDQVTQVRQYSGDDNVSTYQDTILTFDGSDRLKTEHRPEQNTGAVTTYYYNLDDTV